MTDPLCAECAKPVRPTDDTSAIEQVDACTRAVERVIYHSKCRERQARSAG